MAADTGDATSAFVLGFDGIPWSLVERWAGAGKLPSFATLLEEGAAGPLDSTRPATTPLAWPAIATGVGADSHGIYGFQELQPGYSQRMYTSADCDQPALWDLVTPAVVGNVPMTYPVGDVDGAMVAGMMAPSVEAEGFTDPPELAAEIADHVPAYRVGLDWSSYEGRTEAFLDELTSLVEARRTVMRRLLDEDWRLAFFVYTAPDRLQHLAWDERILLEHYRHLDDVLGEVMSRVADRDATLYVVSDHGFGPISTYVHVNTLLEREGYLTRAAPTGTRGALAGLGLDKDAIRGVLDRLGVDPRTLFDRLPRRVTDAVASQVPGDHALYDVEFAETTAFLHGPGNLFVNDTGRFERGTVPPGEVDAVKADLADLLRSVTAPETGEQVLDVDDGDDLFPTDDRSPDLVVSGRGRFEEEKSLTEEVFAPTGVKAGGHRPEGVVFAWGDDVASGVRLSGASVTDVAPTVLHGLGEPVPKNADGSVLRAAFADDSEPGRRAVAKRDLDAAPGEIPAASGDGPDEDLADVEDRLRGLGYLE